MPSDFKAIFEQNKDRYLEEWKELLRFPTVSADPARHGDCLRCAAWLADHLAKIGFQSRLIETGGKPLVFGERPGEPGRPVVLYYGHYDVQPVDPLDQWKTPPFEPTWKDGRIHARGAQDNKGQMMYSLKALETLIRENALRPTVKVILEGEEESTGKSTAATILKQPDLVKADLLVVTDTGMVAAGVPTITMGLRGVIHATVCLRGAVHDLHSGIHGGIAPNPAHGIARLIASLHNPDGSIAVKGFYDSVIEPAEAERKSANAVPFDMASYESRTGVPAVAGEKRFTPCERVGFRPCIDVNGVHSGYGGAGVKTIIPASATAKISARLVAGQDPEFCLKALIEHLERNAPEGLKLEITEKGAAGGGLRLRLDSPYAAKAREVLDTLAAKPAVFRWEGASIPIVSLLARVSGAEPLLVGFGCEEDSIHAPNESFSLEQFRLGFLYVAGLLSRL